MKCHLIFVFRSSIFLKMNVLSILMVLNSSILCSCCAEVDCGLDRELDTAERFHGIHADTITLTPVENDSFLLSLSGLEEHTYWATENPEFMSSAHTGKEPVASFVQNVWNIQFLGESPTAIVFIEHGPEDYYGIRLIE